MPIVDKKETWTEVVPTPLANHRGSWGGEVTAISEYASDHNLMMAFDGIGNSRWATKNDDVPAWIKIALPSARICDFIRIRARTDEWFYQIPTKIQVWGSTDAVTYVKLATVTLEPWAQGEDRRICFPNTLPWRVYKLVFSRPQRKAANISFAQLNIGSRYES
jgi:hypothetical protein